MMTEFCFDAMKMVEVIVSLSFLRHAAASEDFKDLPAYPMDYYCNKRLTLNNVYQFVVLFEPGNIVVPDYVCNVTFTEENDLELRMAVRVVHFENIMGCSQRLVLHDFSSKQDYIICSRTNEYYQSGNHYIYQTWTNSLRFNYVYGGINPQASFEIVVTLFHEGKCRGDEIRCSNGYCIKHSIFCNGHRPCGNVTDSCGDRTIPQPYSATNIVLAVLIPLALLTIVGASLYVYCCRNRRCRGSDSSNSWSPRFWFNISRYTSEGATNPAADEPPDYDSLRHPPAPLPPNTAETPPAYNEVIKDTVKYKVNDNTHDIICYV